MITINHIVTPITITRIRVIIDNQPQGYPSHSLLNTTRVIQIQISRETGLSEKGTKSRNTQDPRNLTKMTTVSCFKESEPFLEGHPVQSVELHQNRFSTLSCHQIVHYTQRSCTTPKIYYNPGQIYYNLGENRALSSRVIPP